MRLGFLIPEASPPAAGLDVTHLAYLPRAVGPGSLYFCMLGYLPDWRAGATAAVARGAAALVVACPLGLGLPEVVVADVRQTFALAAARLHGHPSTLLQVVAVTGTTGKTTTAWLVRELLEADGRPTGLLGSVKRVNGGIEEPSAGTTTPAADELQRALRQMADAGDVACALEVSSQGLAERRTDGVAVRSAVFTNLSRDHLDFHADMEGYFRAKRRLFVEPPPRCAIVNADDAYGARLANELGHATTFGVLARADFRAADVRAAGDGLRFRVRAPEGEVELRSPLLGRFNVYNILGAVAAARSVGVPLDVAASAVTRAAPVPGRLQLVDEGQEFAVLVDYAHSPESLRAALLAARDLTGPDSPGAGGIVQPPAPRARAGGRVHLVFGCGGDRDRGKRPLMGEVASRLADEVIVTSDNPRSEDPEAIIAEIVAGARKPLRCDPDRRAAIRAALTGARRGDVVLIAGKGHERDQLVGGEALAFDDVAVAREALRATGQGRAPLG